MKFTRGQFARIFGITTESLRYLEKHGIIDISRNEENQYLEYTEQEIPIILAIKKFQQAGISLNQMVALSSAKDPNHAEFLDQCVEALEKKKQEAEASLCYLRFIDQVYKEESAQVNHVSLREVKECFYLKFDPKGRNSELIRQCMEYLPHVDLMITVDPKQLFQPVLPVTLALNLPLYIDSCQPLIEVVKKSRQLQQTSPGIYLYKVIFCPDITHIEKSAVQELLDYAAQHAYSFSEPLFGFPMGPAIFNGIKGYYIRLYLLIEKHESVG